jgi:hypothetical protein
LSLSSSTRRCSSWPTWGYGLSFLSRSTSKGTAVPAVLAVSTAVTKRLLEYILLILAIYIASQAAIVILLALIVFQGMRVFSHTKSNLSLMVLFGFTLIFLGHVLMLVTSFSLSSTLYLVGNTIEFCGFVSLLFFLLWSGRVVK